MTDPFIVIKHTLDMGGDEWFDELSRAIVVGERTILLHGEIEERRVEMSSQQKRYRSVKPRVSPTGRTAILVDDGLATGATMQAAVRATTLAKPAQIIVAVPVSPPETARKFAGLVCLLTPWDFQGVGQFYDDFAQVEDETVIAILKEFA